MQAQTVLLNPALRYRFSVPFPRPVNQRVLKLHITENDFVLHQLELWINGLAFGNKYLNFHQTVHKNMMSLNTFNCK